MSMKKMRVRPSSILSVDNLKNDSTCSEETEDRKWLERSDHPLMNHVILTRVFEHVSPYDLMVCRQVCKEWNVASLPQMRATFAVTIHGDNTSPSTKLEEGRGRRVSDFIKTFKSNVLGIPFEKYQLFPFQTTGRCGQQFLQLFGKSVKEIDLEPKGSSGTENGYHGIEDVSEMLKSFLNLQDLKLSFQFVSRSKKIIKLFPDSHSDKPIQLFSLQKIDFCQDSLQQTRLKYCPTFIEELLMAAPNVREITVCDMNEDVEGRERVVVSDNTIVLDLIEKLGKESSIQSLALESAATLNHIQILRTLAHHQPNGLLLKSLSFCPCPESNEGEDTTTIPIQLATIFKDTLEQFHVECASKNNLMEFPKMSKLKSLTLVDLEDFDPKYVDLNRMFPALQKLTIKFLPTDNEDEDEDEDEDFENDFFSQFEPCSNVEELYVHHATMEIHPCHQFLRVFPNLTKLNLEVREVVDVENVREIWSRMIQLKSLSLQVSFEEMMNGESLDSLLTGIPTHTLQLKTIKNVVKKLNGMTEDVRNQNISRLRNEHSELPSIVNLKNLTHLKLSMNAWMGWDTKSRCRYLSDVTGYLALFPMAIDHLHHLEISECGFTRKCCENLTKNTQGTKLSSWRFENERKLIIPALSLRQD